MIRHISLMIALLFGVFSTSISSAETSQLSKSPSTTKAPNKLKGTALFGGYLIALDNVKAWYAMHKETGEVPFELIILQEPVSGISVVGNHYSYCTESTWFIDNGPAIRPNNRHNLSADSKFSLTMRFSDDEWQRLGRAKSVDFMLCGKRFNLSQEEIAAVLYLQTLSKQKR